MQALNVFVTMCDASTLLLFGKSFSSRSFPVCLYAERREDAGDHPLHSSVPAEVLHGEPREPGPAAQKLKSVPESRGTFFLCVIMFLLNLDV